MRVRHWPVGSVVFSLLALDGVGVAQAADAPAIDVRADRLMRSLSDQLACTPALSFVTPEVLERIRRSGERLSVRYSREVVLRRPDSLWVRGKRDDRNGTLWYDGKTLSAQANLKKAYAQAAVAGTLDDVMDYVGERLAIADVLHSSP
jgi:hypothetical protein